MPITANNQAVVDQEPTSKRNLFLTNLLCCVLITKEDIRFGQLGFALTNSISYQILFKEFYRTGLRRLTMQENKSDHCFRALNRKELEKVIGGAAPKPAPAPPRPLDPGTYPMPSTPREKALDAAIKKSFEEAGNALNQLGMGPQ
jgi:hypothetical protein